MKYFARICWRMAGERVTVRVEHLASLLAQNASRCCIGATISAIRLRLPLLLLLRFFTRLALPLRANYAKSLLLPWHTVEMEPLPSQIFSRVLALLCSTNCQSYLSA